MGRGGRRSFGGLRCLLCLRGLLCFLWRRLLALLLFGCPSLLFLSARQGFFRLHGNGGLVANTRLVQEERDATRGLGTASHPMLRPLCTDVHALLLVCQQRVVGANFFNEASVARLSLVGDHDAIKGFLVCARAGKANRKGHGTTGFGRN